jgi:sulfonate transport system substrate-binding protein
MKKTHKYLLGLFLTAILSFGLAGCGSETKSVSGESQANGQSIEVNIAINGGTDPILIGREKGFFEEEFSKVNATIKWSEFASGPPLLESLASKRVDLSFLGDGAALSGLDRGLPFEVIAQTQLGESYNGIIAQPDGDIKQVEDLKGKKVGVAFGTTVHVYLLKALEAYGLTTEDVTLINLQADDAQAAFASKQIDALASGNPFLTVIVEKGDAIKLEVDQKILAPISLIVRTDFGKEHPEIVEAYLRAYKKSIDWQIENPDEASEIYAARTKLPADIIKKIITSEEYGVFISEEANTAQQNSIGILSQVGYIKHEFQYKEHVNDKYLNEALKNE